MHFTFSKLLCWVAVDRAIKISKILLEEGAHLKINDPKVSKKQISKDLNSIQIDLEKVDKTHSQIFDELRSNGLGVNLHYIPVHTQPHYQKMGFKIGDYPNAEKYYGRAISIPLFASMTYEQQDEVVEVLKKVLL